jgi:hypothetical protein
MRREPVVAARGLDDIDVERLDVCVRRPATKRQFHAVDGVLLSLDQYLDTTVRQVPRVAGDSFT